MTSASDIKILTIDDDEQVRELIMAFLADRGYTGLAAGDGKIGLKIFKEEKPDLILLDLRLPKVDGIDILATVVGESPETPVIIVSGMGTLKDAIKAVKFGAWDYITKPIRDMVVLEHAINKALERKELLRLNREYFTRLEREVRERTSELEQRGIELEKAYRQLKKEIEERKRIERAIYKERAFLQTLIDGIIDPAKVIDLEHRVVLMNQASREQIPAEHVDKDDLRCYQLCHNAQEPCSGDDHPCALKIIHQKGGPVSVIHKHRNEKGEEIIYELEASPLWNENGVLDGILEVTRDITEHQSVKARLQEHESRLKHLAHHDTLTSLPNRLLFQDRLQRSIVKAQRSGDQVATLFLGLDRFKKINETLGHDVGDKILCLVAERLQTAVRKSDTIARLGGDEFAIILDEIKHIKDVAIISQKMMNLLADPMLVDSYELFLTSSVGISIFPNDGDNVEGMMKCADAAMTRAKEQGKNNYQFYTVDMNTRAFEFLLLESSLRKALTQEELVIYYQPQFDLDGDKLLGAEALLRWNHPERGLMDPDDFIPLAEETGLIEQIGEWVLLNACRQNMAWQKEGYPPMRIAVNISARQFRQRNIVEMVNNVLKQTMLAPEYLELELTESLVMHNAAKTIETLKKLKEMGVFLSIDDFGTGYSSLSYLKYFPIDTLKIDRSFVKNLDTDPNDAMIASSVIALAHSLDLTVIAEGVENEKQLEFLRAQNCDSIQGYLYGRPLPPDRFIRFFTPKAERKKTDFL